MHSPFFEQSSSTMKWKKKTSRINVMGSEKAGFSLFLPKHEAKLPWGRDAWVPCEECIGIFQVDKDRKSLIEQIRPLQKPQKVRDKWILGATWVKECKILNIVSGTKSLLVKYLLLLLSSSLLYCVSSGSTYFFFFKMPNQISFTTLPWMRKLRHRLWTHPNFSKITQLVSGGV